MLESGGRHLVRATKIHVRITHPELTHVPLIVDDGEEYAATDWPLAGTTATIAKLDANPFNLAFRGASRTHLLIPSASDDILERAGPIAPRGRGCAIQNGSGLRPT